MQVIQSIQNRIYEVRGERIILGKDLADLYEIPLKSLILTVKRNIKRFPEDFMFQLTREEFEALRFQIETLENPGLHGSQALVTTESLSKRASLRSQIVTLKGRGLG